ncbi:MAG: hypothetical protein KDB27_05380 [Planctomycetales bacterium]|nr:hypothetical protein [Planctomycetales bacterium]
MLTRITNRKNKSKSKKKSQNRVRRNGNQISVESLENRELMAADISFANNVISIQGTNANDVVSVAIDAGNTSGIFNHLDDQVVVSVQTGRSQVTESFPRYKGFLSNVNSISFNGNDGNDRFQNNTNITSIAVGGNGDDVLIGGTGNDTLVGDKFVIFGSGDIGYGNDQLYGGDGNDILHGQNGSDTLNGGDGNDQLFGGAGNDAIYGGSGNDTAKGGDGQDRIYGGSGNDTLDGENHNDKVYGDYGDDVLRGGDGNDILSGGLNNDFLDGESGNDTLDGGSGNDTIKGGSGNDSITGSYGDDTIWGESGDDTVDGGYGDDNIHGGDGDDVIRGYVGNDTLRGDSGNDVLRGDSGNDYLYGGSGHDSLYGHDGVDRLYGESGLDGLFGGDGVDLLWGGSGQDRFLSRGIQLDELWQDKTSSEAVVTFEPGSYTVYDQVFLPASWSDAEIEQVDAALAVMHQSVGSTKLLKQANGDPITFLQRKAVTPTNKGGWNSGGTITIVENGPISKGLVFHEIAHNWDSNLFTFPAFKQISGWTSWPSYLPVPAGYMRGNNNLSGDTSPWIYKTNANFASNYARTNPNEDFAESFEAYFKEVDGTNYTGPNIDAKFDYISNFIVGANLVA